MNTLRRKGTLGHRARLTLVAAASAGVLLALVFGGVVVETRAEETRAADEILRTVLAQARDEVSSSPQAPDLAEITRNEPRATIALFGPGGRLAAKAGTLPLSGDVGAGKTRIGGVEAVVATAKQGGTRLVAAVPWTGRETALNRLALLLAALWVPLTACAGAATWLASRATFLPLDELARQAESLASGDLSGRLTLAGDDEYARFTARLNHFLALYEESVRRQERFLQDAAHELRTPLAILRTRLETTALRERTGEEYRQALGSALRETERLVHLAEALLRLAAPTSAASGTTDLALAVARAQARWLDRFAARQVGLDLDVQEARAALSEVEAAVLLDNLLSNALRASPAGGRCLVRASSPPGEGMAVLSVEDEGSGVPEELSEAIFERFARGDDARNRDAGGFGIGLALCRRIAAARGGSIRVEPASPGARFVVEIPKGGVASPVT